MKGYRGSKRSAITLLELVVVLAIIGVLLALLMPAVQRIRDAAARVQCANNLHQLALGAHQYHDVTGAFPSGMRYRNGTDPYLLMSWQTSLLPYVEQDALWGLTQTAYRESMWPLNNPPHIGLSTVMSVFVCPSDGRASQVQIAQREKIPVALTCYLGVEGTDAFSQDGVLFRDSHIRMADIKDGTSQTLFAGERPPSTDFQFGWWYAGAGQLFTGSADMVLGVQERNVLPVTVGYAYGCPPGPYSFGPGQTSNQCDMFHFWSLHSGGANFLFADGSVHFLSYSAAPILPALATRSGGEAVALP